MSSKTPRQRPSGDKTLSANVEELQVGDTAKKTTKSGTTKQSDSQSTEDKPKYLQLERTEARLRSDQVDELARLRRRVAANRDDKTERITDNTLIRLAVDLLLTRADELDGDTEDALRASLTD